MLNLATKKFIEDHWEEDVRKLALKGNSIENNDIDFSFALVQIAGRKRIKHKLPSWYNCEDIIYPSTLALEQCSSETTAQYKASILSGDSLVDLTGGFGVDISFISSKFKNAFYIEKQLSLVEIVKHNFDVLGLNNIEIQHTSAIDFLNKTPWIECIYIDPARRSSSGNKVVLLEDCDPNLLQIQDLLLEKSKIVAVKLSPMLDIHAAMKALKNLKELHIISVENECKELLFLMERDYSGNSLIVCVNFYKEKQQTDTFNYTQEIEAHAPLSSELMQYIYEPNSSILKGGFYKSIALKYKVNKLHNNTHLYTSSELIKDFPGRVFEVIDFSTMNKKELTSFLKGIDKAHLSIRNFPDSVDSLRKKIKVKEGGDMYLFATTLENEKRVIIKARRVFI